MFTTGFEITVGLIARGWKNCARFRPSCFIIDRVSRCFTTINYRKLCFARISFSILCKILGHVSTWNKLLFSPLYVRTYMTMITSSWLLLPGVSKPESKWKVDTCESNKAYDVYRDGVRLWTGISGQIKIQNKTKLFWERPFNLKGGGLWFFSKKIFWFPMFLKKILIMVEEKKNNLIQSFCQIT